jgi:hypothetical protein
VRPVVRTANPESRRVGSEVSRGAPRFPFQPRKYPQCQWVSGCRRRTEKVSWYLSPARDEVQFKTLLSPLSDQPISVRRSASRASPTSACPMVTLTVSSVLSLTATGRSRGSVDTTTLVVALDDEHHPAPAQPARERLQQAQDPGGHGRPREQGQDNQSARRGYSRAGFRAIPCRMAKPTSCGGKLSTPKMPPKMPGVRSTRYVRVS